MKINEIFDGDLFRQMVDEKMINIRSHDELDLYIANYSDLAQYKRVWNPVTTQCRGLIYDVDENILARPFSKFWNLGEAQAAWIPFDARVEVTDKMDGSLGILYPHFFGATRGSDFSVATRGSFHSSQAEWATQLWHNDYSHLTVPADTTFLFEIVY